jgi:hypothetical protein
VQVRRPHDEIAEAGMRLVRAGFPLQHTDIHDHSYLIVFASGQSDRPIANCGAWYELQPFAIGLLTSECVLTLWKRSGIRRHPGSNSVATHTEVLL